MKVIAHANNWSLTLALHIILYLGTSEFYRAQAWVCLGVATDICIDETNSQDNLATAVGKDNY